MDFLGLAGGIFLFVSSIAYTIVNLKRTLKRGIFYDRRRKELDEIGKLSAQAEKFFSQEEYSKARDKIRSLIDKAEALLKEVKNEEGKKKINELLSGAYNNLGNSYAELGKQRRTQSIQSEILSGT